MFTLTDYLRKKASKLAVEFGSVAKRRRLHSKTPNIAVTFSLCAHAARHFLWPDPKEAKLSRVFPLGTPLVLINADKKFRGAKIFCSAVHPVIYPLAPKSTGASGVFLFFARHTVLKIDILTDTRHIIPLRFARKQTKGSR